MYPVRVKSNDFNGIAYIKDTYGATDITEIAVKQQLEYEIDDLSTWREHYNPKLKRYSPDYMKINVWIEDGKCMLLNIKANEVSNMSVLEVAVYI